jgi:hypothetical protein
MKNFIAGGGQEEANGDRGRLAEGGESLGFVPEH